MHKDMATNKINPIDFAGLLSDKESANLIKKIRENRNLSKMRLMRIEKFLMNEEGTVTVKEALERAKKKYKR